MVRTLVLALAALLPLPAVARGQGDSTPALERRVVLDGTVVLEDVPEIPERIADALHRFQNVRSAALVDWAADGEGLFITTRFGDVVQLHRVAMPGGARTQLTFYDEPLNGVARRSGHPEVLFSMDEGGAEFFQLFLYDPASGEARRLTDGTSRNTGGEWSNDGSRLAYTSTRRDGRSNDVWVMEVADTSSARILVQAGDGAFWGAADWDPEGGRILVEHYVSIADSRIHLLDVATGELRRIAGGADARANWTSIEPAFTPDGRGAFIASDAESEFAHLGVLDLGSGEVRWITEAIPWDVEGFELSRDGTRAAFLVNQGAISRLYLLDPRSLEYAPVDGFPTGTIGDLAFSPDGRRLAIQISTPRTPSDVYVFGIDAPTVAGELARWTYSEVGGLDTDSFVTPELVHYTTFDGREIPAFVYAPGGAGPHPVVVYIHGGPESQYRPSFSSTFQMWVKTLGAAVVAPNVRGSAGYGKTYVGLDNGRNREDSVRDIGALLDWIGTRSDLDPSRVAVYGGSYGGYMVLASLVHYSDRLRGGVDNVGISSFVTFLENTQDYRRDLRRAEYGDERDSEMRRHLESISPLAHADRIRAPLFVAQGANDPRVPVTEAEQIVREVRDNGHQVWYMKALHEGHGFDKKPNVDLFQQITVLFFEQNLLGQGPVSD